MNIFKTELRTSDPDVRVEFEVLSANASRNAFKRIN